MRILLFDKRETFLWDVSTRLMIDDDRSVEVVGSASSVDNIYTMIEKETPDAILFASNMADDLEDWHFPNCKTIVYVPENETPVQINGIDSIGVISTSEQFLNILEGGIPEVQSAKSQNIPSLADQNEVVQHNETVKKKEPPTTKEPYVAPYQSKPQSEFRPTGDYTAKPSAQQNNDINTLSVKERLNRAAAEENKRIANNALKEELQKAKTKAKVVTIYSSKGGVGKTTISTELAVALANTSVGRGNLRVCIVDLNIDFGDVLTTLDYDARGNNLSFWAAEVRERLREGEAVEDIQYSRKEIEEHLQTNSFGLYALIAPIAHEDSMEIESQELEIILDNIIKNGEFDFVVCDTGNNTGDASVLALEKSDDIFLVVTQDVSTASCNSAFLSTMQKIDFDMSKIKLLINSVMPFKVTQVGVEELEQMFPYQCVARIKRSSDVIKANNCSKPIVLTDATHEFTKEMKNIIAYLLGQEPIETVQRKKGFFSRLFKKGER